MIVDYDFKIVGVSISFESLDIDAQIVYMEQKYQKIGRFWLIYVLSVSF